MSSLRACLPSGSSRVFENLNTQTFRYLNTQIIFCGTTPKLYKRRAGLKGTGLFSAPLSY